MSDIAIKLENISKQYRLGTVGTGTLSHDLNRWFARVRGKEDPSLKIGQENSLAKAGGDYVWALKDINLEVKQGEILGIIGKNGAGKSTLLKLLSQVTGPTTGSIKVNGRIASLLEVGTGFHPELTGRENIFLNGAILGMTKNDIKRKLDEVIEFAGVAKYVDTPVKRYSSGMYVRLAFAVAAHLEPDILVVDEVLAVGDAEFQKKAIGKMQDVSKGGERTVLFVSHNMTSIKQLCTKTIVLENGTVGYHGKADDAINNYLSTSVKDNNLNLAERTDREGNGDFVFTEIYLKNKAGKILTDFFSGEEINIVLHFKKKKYIELSKMVIGVNIIDNYQNVITYWVSDEMNITFNDNANEIILHIPSINLREGNYNVRLFSSYIKAEYDRRCDVVENATILQILGNNYFGKKTRKSQTAIIDGIFKTTDKKNK